MKFWPDTLFKLNLVYRQNTAYTLHRQTHKKKKPGKLLRNCARRTIVNTRARNFHKQARMCSNAGDNMKMVQYHTKYV